MEKCDVCNGTGFYTGLDGVTERCYKCGGIGDVSNIDRLLKANQELREAIEQLLKNEEYRILLYSISKTSPVMMWAKDTEGVYTYANDALAKHLFDSECGSDLIGKDDVEIVTEIMKKYPKWTFGTICVGTDKMVLEQQKPMKFFEWGVVKDKFEYVVAYKAPYYDRRGMLLGTTGVATYVTEEVNELISILNETKDENTRKRLKKYLSRYGFGQEVFTNQNIDDVWKGR